MIHFFYLMMLDLVRAGAACFHKGNGMEANWKSSYLVAFFRSASSLGRICADLHLGLLDPGC
uniref:Secreted protein n=1 Tax=Nelumbo nucifera TaxID=4432 RepID=A0A822Y9S7_NELNU|nr:TPA_asm: hypothetical protein HUJ06_029364 [Nelumbo nucifera]